MLDKDQVDVNSDSDNDTNVENRSNNINNNNNNNTNNPEEVSSSKENIHERVSMATSKENLDTLVINNNTINILGDSSSKLVNSSSSPSTHSTTSFLPKTEIHYQHHPVDTGYTTPPDPPSSEPSDMRTSYSSINHAQSSTHADKKPIDTSVLKTISAPCS